MVSLPFDEFSNAIDWNLAPAWLHEMQLNCIAVKSKSVNYVFFNILSADVIVVNFFMFKQK